MLKDASIEKIKLEKIIDCKPVWEKKYFFVFWTCCSDQIDQTAILCFLTFQRMSSAILDDWTPDESAAAKSSQGIKPRKLSFIAQCIVSDDHLYGLFCEMHLGWMALFGHSICWKGSFGRGSAACYAWPTCPAAERVPKKKKPPPSRSVSTQPCRAASVRLGGSRVEGRQGGASHAVSPDPPETPPGGRDSLWAHLYFSYSGDCSLCRVMAGGQTQQRCSGFSCSSHHSWAQDGQGAVSALLLAGPELHGNILLHKLWVWKGLQGKQPFIPVRLRATG